MTRLGLANMRIRTLALKSERYRNRTVAVVISGTLWLALAPNTAIESGIPKPETPEGRLLADATHLAFLHNWPHAARLFAPAEALYAAEGDKRNELYAHIGRLRGDVEALSLPEVSAFLTSVLNSAIGQQDLKLRLFCLVAKGDIDFQIDPKSSENTWAEVEALARRLGDHAWENRAGAELGTIAFYKGQIFRAARLVAAGSWAAERMNDIAYVIRLRAALGEGFAEFGRYGDALVFFENSLKLAAETRDVGFPFTAYLGKARCLVALGREKEGEEILQSALDDAIENHMQVREARLLLALGELADKRGISDRAAEYFRRALELARKQQLYRLTAAASSRLASLVAKRSLQKAEVFANEGVQDALSGGDEFDLPRRLATAAEVALRGGDLLRADHDYGAASELIDQLLRNVAPFDEKDFLLSSVRQVYLGQARVGMMVHSPEKAFNALEHAYARGVSESLRFPSARPQLAREFTPQSQLKISSLQGLLFHENRSGKRREILDQIWETEKRGFIIREADRVAGREGIIDVSGLQPLLKPDELLLDYALDKPSSMLIAIDQRTITAYRLPSEGVLNGLIAAYLSAVQQGSESIDAGRRLAEALVGPVAGRPQPRWIVIAHENLQMVPFESLIGPDNRYLVESRVITYVPSATVLSELRTRALPRPDKGVLAIGGIRYESERIPSLTKALSRGIGTGLEPRLFDWHAAPSFLPIPGSRRELVDAAAKVPESKILLDRLATEARVKSEPLDSYEILHFAVHVAVDPGHPERSGLVLANDTVSREDGLLQAREITQLRLGDQLVILSGCNTGTPLVQDSFIDASLVRAFLFAGANSILAALWVVNDDFAAYFMDRFYTHLSQGDDEALSLSMAKRDAIRNFQSVGLWAGFRLTGDGNKKIN